MEGLVGKAVARYMKDNYIAEGVSGKHKWAREVGIDAKRLRSNLPSHKEAAYFALRSRFSVLGKRRYARFATIADNQDSDLKEEMVNVFDCGASYRYCFGSVSLLLFRGALNNRMTRVCCNRTMFSCLKTRTRGIDPTTTCLVFMCAPHPKCLCSTENKGGDDETSAGHF